MTYTEAQNKAYALAQKNTDSDIVFGTILDGNNWAVAAWDITERTRIDFNGGFSIECKRVL